MLRLIKPHIRYAKDIFDMTSNEEVVKYLAFRNKSMDDVFAFLNTMEKEEQSGETRCRFILAKQDLFIGTTTLSNISLQSQSAFIGTWIDREYWGKGYNSLSKKRILTDAFENLGLEKVFIGADRENIRSRKAQEKLGFVTFDVHEQYPDEHALLEKKQGAPVVLNVIYKRDFFKYLESENL
jgi:RimJ/RimL family protein N-acetyltransferase